MHNTVVVVALAVFLSGCAAVEPTTTSVTLRKSETQSLQDGIEFVLRNRGEAQSYWVVETTGPICHLSFDVTVLDVFPRPTNSALARVELINRQSDESFSLLILWDPESSMILPLLAVEDSDNGEYLNIEFDPKETYSMSFNGDSGEYTLIAEPKGKWDSLEGNCFPVLKLPKAWLVLISTWTKTRSVRSRVCNRGFWRGLLAGPRLGPVLAGSAR